MDGYGSSGVDRLGRQESFGPAPLPTKVEWLALKGLRSVVAQDDE